MKLFRLSKNTTVEIISSLFILLFVYTGVSKLTDHTAFENVLRKSPLIDTKAAYISWALPIIELVVAGLLFVPRTKKIGLFCSLALMIGFTGYLVYMIYFTPTLPCSCGGVLAQMTWKQHLIFNISFTLLAILGLILLRNKNKFSPKGQYKQDPKPLLS